MDGHLVQHEVVRATNVFLILYVIIFALSVLLVGFDGHDLVTNFTGVASALNNIGPGLQLVGPMGNFGVFSSGAQFVLSLDMLAGRLELFPLLVLFMPKTWKSFKDGTGSAFSGIARFLRENCKRFALESPFSRRSFLL